jgi:hypothetical protein
MAAGGFVQCAIWFQLRAHSNSPHTHFGKIRFTDDEPVGIKEICEEISN